MKSDPTPTPGAGWHPDPSSRFEFRWFNGTAWTQDVSVAGVRYVDQPSTGPSYGPSSGQSHGAHRPPSKTMAVIGSVLGIVSVLIAWIPFLFVLGAAGAVAAITLGIITLKRVRTGRARGRALATIALATGCVALALCWVGWRLTVSTLNEFAAYTDPGPTDTSIDSCEASGARVIITGTLTNLDDTVHDYDIGVEVRRGRRLVGVEHQAVVTVDPGETTAWRASMFDDNDSGVTSAPLSCEVIEVTGPFPFGLDPNP